MNEKAITIDFFMPLFVDLLAITSLLILLNLSSISMASAYESQNPSTDNTDPAQPSVPAAEPETKQVPAEITKPRMPSNSMDFIVTNSPLSRPTALESAPASKTFGAENVTLEVLQGTIVEQADEMAILVSEQCSQEGAEADGTRSCERVYSNGHHATVLDQSSHEGDEVKRQTIIEEFDGNNNLLYKKTIRQRLDYNYVHDQKAKEKELFDIIYQPTGKKTTRELMVYEYFLETGKTKSLSWTQYKQIGNEPRAELTYHALLNYDKSGNPERGLAEKWDHGKKTDTFINWDRRSKGFASLEQENWNQWEGWIRNVSLQAYLP